MYLKAMPIGSAGIMSDINVAKALYEARSSSGSATVNANGHEYVDLGLPSGTLWANLNLSYDGNDYFFFGGSTEYWDNNPMYPMPPYCDNYQSVGYPDSRNYTKYNETDNLTTLELSDDVVNIYYGGDWHSPTISLLTELLSFTVYEYREDGSYLTSICNGQRIYIGNDLLDWMSSTVSGTYEVCGLDSYYSIFVSNLRRDHAHKVRPVIQGTANQSIFLFNGYVSGLGETSEDATQEENDAAEIEIRKYILKWINRPYEDLIADATQKNDLSTLYALAHEASYKEYFEEHVLNGDHGSLVIMNEASLNYLEYENEEPYFSLNYDGYYFNYYPSTGYVSIYLYEG